MSYGRVVMDTAAKTRNGRGRGIRTHDPLLPKQVRYQTALYPVQHGFLAGTEILFSNLRRRQAGFLFAPPDRAFRCVLQDNASL